MENENKNGSVQKQHNSADQKKNKPPKHRSYFIEPNGDQKSVQKSETTKQENSANTNQQPKGNNQRNNHHHNRGNHRKNETRPQNQESKSHESSQEQVKTEQSNKPVADNQNAAKHNSNNNRNRNKHNPDKRKDDKNRNQKPDTVLNEPTPDNNDTLRSIKSSAPSTKSADKLQRPAAQKVKNFSESPEFNQYSDYEEFSFEELYGEDKFSSAPAKSNSDNPQTSVSENSDPEPMLEVVGIRFKASGKTYYFDPKGINLRVGTHAIVETARGIEYGEVAMGNTMVRESETVPPLRTIIRKATDSDDKHHAENREKEDVAFRVCNEKIIDHELDMKLIDAQYTFDNSKLIFYFTSSGRVDFRDLVKDLASVFRTRIELRQIGIRDEAKMVGGLGLCGRPLCCSLFLTDFGQVSIKMAKEQNLSLNSSKISGVCGRLMCCLRYEHDTYEYEIKRTPPVDSIVRTVDGIGVVTEINPLAATIKVKLNSSLDTPPKSYKRDEVTVLKKKQENS